MRRVVSYLSAVVLLFAAPASTTTAEAASSCARPATSATEMNTRTGQIDGLGSGDAFRTSKLADGRWLSLTGDAARPGETLPAYDNAAVIWDQAGQRRVDVPGGDFFPRWEDGSEFWPAGMVVSGRTVYVIGSRQLTSGTFDWQPMGAYGAVVDVPWCGTPRFVRYFATPSSGLDDSVVQWSATITAYGSYWYVHGVLDRPDLFHARDGAYVARMPAGQVEDLSTWRYWTGSAWVASAAAAVTTIPSGPYGSTVGGTEAGYTVHKRADGKWQLTTKRGGTLASTLGRYVSAYPVGPWTWQPLLDVCDLDCYLTGAAPTIPTVSGQTLVLWSRTGTTPQWAEVPTT
ncbi:hypothetical protein [Micromonospora chersina]